MTLSEIIARIKGISPPLPTNDAPFGHQLWLMHRETELHRSFAAKIKRMAEWAEQYQSALNDARLQASRIDGTAATEFSRPTTKVRSGESEHEWLSVRKELLRDLLFAGTGNELASRLSYWAGCFSDRSRLAEPADPPQGQSGEPR